MRKIIGRGLMNGKRRIIPIAVVAAGSLVLGACQLAVNTAGYSAGSGPGGSGLVGETLTNTATTIGPDSTFQYSGAGTNVTVTANGMYDNNEREAFWFDNSPVEQDEESCATWQSGSGISQQGAVLHLTRTSDGGVRAITVMKNIYAGALWEYNFDTWDSGNVANPFTELAGVNLSQDPGVGTNTYPIHLCARTVGDQLEFVAWGSGSEPAYGTPNMGGSVTIPSDFQNPGIAGWYIGHLSPGSSAAFSDLSTS